MSPLIIITGTGTGIGKTFIATALVSAWRRVHGNVVGVKPIESGMSSTQRTDVDELEQVSMFHVKRDGIPPYLLAHPVSPHRAARLDGTVLDLDLIDQWITGIRREVDGVVVELAGGLFSPLRDDGATNADLLQRLAATHPSKVLLVAPDRLGVLHDVIATTKAARGVGITIDAVVLSAPVIADASTGTNRDELARFIEHPIHSIPRTSRAEAEHLLTPLFAFTPRDDE